MSSGAETAYLLLLLVFPLSALLVRRLPLGATVKMALAWFAIFTVAFVIVELWQLSAGAGGRIAMLFH